MDFDMKTETPEESSANQDADLKVSIPSDVQMTMATPDNQNQNENQTDHFLNQLEVQQLRDQVEYYKQSASSLETQMVEEIQHNRNLKLKLQSRDELVQNLIKEIKRRDNIFDLCCNRHSNGQQEVYMESNSDGHRIFEIQDKQQVPYMVKIERLSPIIHENVTDDDEADDDAEIIMSSDDADNYNNNNNNDIEVPQSISKKYDSPKQEPSSSNFREHESSSTSNSNSLHSSPSLSISKSKSRTASTSRRSRKRNMSPIQKQQHQNKYSEKRSKMRERSPSFSYENVDDVLTIPEVYRTNFGTSEWEVGQSLAGIKFWYDPDYSTSVKIYIRLYDDCGDWRKSKLFTVKEQIALSLPTTCHLKFPDLIAKLEKISNPRIWLDVRSFNVLIQYMTVQHILPPKILSSVSHFSYGGRLYSDSDIENGNGIGDVSENANEEKLMSNELVEFIFNRLPNLEFCCINNGLLRPFDARPSRYPQMERLCNLTTIQLVHSRQKFSTPFILSILKMSPNLKNFYDFPLHSLKELAVLKMLELPQFKSPGSSSGSTSSPRMINIFDRVSIRSVYIRRDCYNKSEDDALNLLEDLKLLSKQRPNTLQELNTTLSFLVCKPSTRLACLDRISKIIMRNEETIERIKISTRSLVDLKIQRLENVKTLCLYLALKSRFFHNSDSKKYGIDFPYMFPNLTKVEIAVDFSNANFKKEAASPFSVFNQHFPSAVFKPNHSFKNVQSLKLFGFCLEETMPRIAALFPRLKILCFHNSLSSVSSVLESVYKFWPGLVELQLEINTNTKYTNLDSAISGINKAMCERLWKSKHSKLSTQEEEIKRCLSVRGDKLSIHHLKGLQRLKITLRCSSPTFLGANDELPVLTLISGLALSGVGCREGRRDKLQVIIDFDERVTSSEKKKIISSLSPILQFSCITIER